MPDTTKTATHVMVKRAKPTPLGRRYDGPFEIKERLGESTLRIKVGDSTNGEGRTELRHWNSCYPVPPNFAGESAQRPTRGRKKLNANAEPFVPKDNIQDSAHSESRLKTLRSYNKKQSN